jgi:hypothetical protein
LLDELFEILLGLLSAEEILNATIDIGRKVSGSEMDIVPIGVQSPRQDRKPNDLSQGDGFGKRRQGLSCSVLPSALATVQRQQEDGGMRCVVVAALLGTMLFACTSDTGGGPSGGSGGVTGKGGSKATGGASTSTGGAPSTGGSGSDGSVATGGRSSAGGSLGNGGGLGSGGTLGTGGGVGGNTSHGGATGTGGTTATGGSAATDAGLTDALNAVDSRADLSDERPAQDATGDTGIGRR